MFQFFTHVSVGNNMISSAIWNKWARVNFSKTTKSHEPVGEVQFVVENWKIFFEKLKVKTKFWKRTGAISNLHSCYNFALGIIWECTCGASGSEQSMQEKNKSEIVLTLKLLKNLSNSNESNQITSLENGNRRPLATHNHLLWSSL